MAPGESGERRDWQGWPQGAAAGKEALPPGPPRPALLPSPLPSPSLLPLQLLPGYPRPGLPPNAFQVWTRPLPHPGAAERGQGRCGSFTLHLLRAPAARPPCLLCLRRIPSGISVYSLWLWQGESPPGPALLFSSFM